MLPLCVVFILLFWGNSAKASTLTPPTNTTQRTQVITTPEVRISSVQLSGTPQYPVAAGQRVSLNCSVPLGPKTIYWSWSHQRFNNIWHTLDVNVSELILTEPEQSGEYRCIARSPGGQRRNSITHRVLIISIQTTAWEKLGVAAFVISIAILIIGLVILFWILSQRVHQEATASSTAAKSFPTPGMTSKGVLPEKGMESDVYMNYTNSNPGYSDLDLSSVTEDNVYSSLS
ncbi:unnamed protein product [Ophioblennius macclurei]